MKHFKEIKEAQNRIDKTRKELRTTGMTDEEAESFLRFETEGYTMPVETAKALVASDKANITRFRQVQEALEKRRVKTTKSEKEKKKTFLTLFKRSQGCCICGYNDDPLGLDLDHKDRNDKTYSIGDLPKKNWKVIFEELSKCQVLCAICHRFKTESERLSLLINNQQQHANNNNTTGLQGH